uniref:Uncharacterized protein n=1 Tax=Anguilla anguilla TaxID=7936 RepID=A0A0E9S3A4_ANGAN
MLNYFFKSSIISDTLPLTFELSVCELIVKYLYLVLFCTM